MQPKSLKRNVSRIYLLLVPLLVSVFGLGVGYISYKIYLPIWIINVLLMIVATWILGAHYVRGNDIEKKHIVISAMFLVAPWMLISMFFGLGAPPFGKPAAWVASATEQEVRYIFLIVAGVFYSFGFAVLRGKLKNTNGNFFSLLGMNAIQIAIPLFLLDMVFLCFYVEKLYGIMLAAGSEKLPPWALPIVNQFNIIPIITGSLIYLATAAFAASLKSAGWFKPAACNIYMVISLLGFLFNILPPSFPEPLATMGFITTIPAVPFLMPYLMGVNLLSVLNHRVSFSHTD